MQTIFDLFKELGFSDIEKLPINIKIIPSKTIEVKSFNIISKIIEWKKVTGLFYKGKSDINNTYEVLSKNSTFLCTGDHLLWDIDNQQYVSAKKLSEYFTSIDREGKSIEVKITPISSCFPILDIEVEDNHNYFTGEALSHNSFGGGGKLFSEGLKKLNPYVARNNVGLILLRQMRAKVGSMPSYGPPDTAAGGGYAPEFYASWRARVSKVEDIMDKTEVIGNSIKVKNVKSKIGFPKRSAILDLYYGSGFNPEAEYMDFIIDLGIVQKKASWLSNEQWGFKGQGQKSLLEFLQGKPDLFDEVKKEVNSLFEKHSMLDDNEVDENEPVVVAQGEE